MGKKVYVKCKLKWARLMESNRDMGSGKGDDMDLKLKLMQGQYVVECLIDDATKEKMIADGIPDKGAQAQLFKVNKDGEMIYKAKRYHFNPKFKDENGELGVVMGPPEVLKKTDTGYEKWDWETDGLIGNYTYAEVKFDVWNKTITNMEKVCILELVPFTPEEKF